MEAAEAAEEIEVAAAAAAGRRPVGHEAFDDAPQPEEQVDGVDGAAEAQPAVGEDDLRPVAAVDAGEHLAHRLPLAVAQRALVAQQAGALQRGRQRLARRAHTAEQRQRRRRRLEAGGDREGVGVRAAAAPPALQVAREAAGAVVAELELEGGSTKSHPPKSRHSAPVSACMSKRIPP